MEIARSKHRGSLRKRLLWITALTVVNIVAFNVFVREDGYDASGQIVPYSPEVALRASLQTFLLALPLTCIILGALIALPPYRSRPYWERVKRTSSLLALVLNAILAMCLLLIGATSLFFPEYRESARPVNDLVHQKQEIHYFVQDITALRDSALITIEGPGTNNTKELRLAELGQRIDARTRAFSAKAKEMRVTQNVTDSLFTDLNGTLRPLLMKFDSLRSAGLRIE